MALTKFGTTGAPVQVQQLALAIRPPTRSLIWPIAVTTSAEQVVIPSAWKNAYVDIHASGGTLYLAFGDVTLTTIDETARVSKTGTPVVLGTPGGTECIAITDGERLPMGILDASYTHFVMKGSAAMVLRVHVSSF